MKDKKAAIRYARALISLAKADGRIDQVRLELKALLDALSVNKKACLWFSDNRVSVTKRQHVLRELSGELHLSPLTVKFAEVLVMEGRIGDLGAIFPAFCELADEACGIMRGEITSISREIGEKVMPPVAASLERSMKKRMDFSLNVDPSMIGGLKIKIKDKVWDLSVKRRLDAIKEEL